jgi:hypothetical protein
MRGNKQQNKTNRSPSFLIQDRGILQGQIKSRLHVSGGPFRAEKGGCEGSGGHKRKKNITISKLLMARNPQEAQNKISITRAWWAIRAEKEAVKAVVGTNEENITISKLFMARSPQEAQNKISITCVLGAPNFKTLQSGNLRCLVKGLKSSNPKYF